MEIETLEHCINNNLLFKPIPIHTCPLLYEHIIKYKEKKELSIKKLVDNSIHRYIKDINDAKKLYEKKENFNKLYSEVRFKNYLSKYKIEQIKYHFLNSSLIHLELIVSSMKNPYMDYLYRLLNAVNYILYIKKVQFNSNGTQYNYDNYQQKISSKEETAQAFLDENNLQDSKLHKGLIESYKKNKIEGSLMIQCIVNQAFNPVQENKILDKKDRLGLQRNQFFHKSFEKVNFTEKELINGYAQVIYYNFAHHNYKAYKLNRKESNKNGLKAIPYIRKDDIKREVIDMFNLVFEKEVISHIRSSSKIPKILKYYDDIPIYTTKNIYKLEKEFYNFVCENIFSENENLKTIIQKNEKEFYQIVLQIRPQLY